MNQPMNAEKESANEEKITGKSESVEQMGSPTAQCQESLARFLMPLESMSEDASVAANAFDRDGLLYLKGLIPESIADSLYARVQDELTERRADENHMQWFGEVYGSEEVGEVGCRWDLKLRLSVEVCTVLEILLGTAEDFMKRIYPSWQLAELAAMCTFPGDPCQPVHADTSHIYDKRHITFWIALHDISSDKGPTKMYPRTHVDGSLHMGYTQPDENSALLCTMRRGDCCVMDSRLLHCGTANQSQDHRYLFYCTWMPPVRRSRGSTNTLLPEYDEQFYLRTWREWTGGPSKTN